MKVLVSACLLGRNCKYNGGNNENAAVPRFLQGKTVIPVCPEELAGLGTPRAPVEIVNGRIRTREGVDLDAPLRSTAALLAAHFKAIEVDCAVLQSRSPTCGVHQVYDGTFSGRRIPGSGVFAQALRDAGIEVIDAEDLV